jgi:glutathione S-transferase
MPDDDLIRAEIDAYRAEARAYREETVAFRAQTAAQFEQLNARFDHLEARFDRQEVLLGERLDRQDTDIATIIRTLMEMRGDNGSDASE